MSTDFLINEAKTLLQRERQREAIATTFAPGRVNLIGEHTDYNEGLVLPCALGMGTAVAVAPRNDGEIHAVSATGAHLRQDRFLIHPTPTPLEKGAWSNYLRGMVAEVTAAGITLPGADLAIVGDIPQGAGLSSSASLSVAVGRALLSLIDSGASRSPPPVMLAQWAQSTEHRYAGCLCGIMDQMTAAAASPGEAILIDCRDNSFQAVEIPSAWSVLIIDSGIRRELVGGEYNRRREQCEAAARHYAVPSLRELERSQLESQRGMLSETIFRRARHVVTENERVRDAVNAMEHNDLVSFGQVLRASHDSLRKDFEVTIPQVDALAASANDLIDRLALGYGGARMTGGGFGGCIVAVVPAEYAAVLKRELAEVHDRPVWVVARQST